MAAMRPRLVHALLLLLTGVLSAAVLDTEALRLAAGRKLSAGREMRTWKFKAFPEPMQDWSSEVKGAFVELRCEDREFSSAVLILLREDYRLRSYPAKLLTPSDRALAEKLEQQRRSGLATKKSTEYPLVLKYYTKETAEVTSSPHFAFYTGPDRAGSGKKAFAPGFLDQQKYWYDKVWSGLEELGCPMPMAGEASPHKLNVFVTGTGLSRHKEGFAFGAADIIVHPAAMGDGSSVIPHEFGHTVQFYSKGFRDSRFVGWFWECHANWTTHQFMPGYPPVLMGYAEKAHYELNSSRHNYGSWPFLQVLTEDPRFGPSFPFDIWPACRRDDKGAALEDPFQVIMRLGVERGIWKDGPAGFGDTIGELAARMAGWDFQNQYFYCKEARSLERNPGRVNSLAVVLEPGADGRWRPLHSHAPKQYGVNLVGLNVAPGASQVEADFTGIADPAISADWRVTLVATDKRGLSRYSQTVRGGKLSLDVKPGERLTLAIAATPSTYEPLEFRPGYAVKRRYPYSVAFKGAAPQVPAPFEARAKPPGGPHPNGGGFVAKTAKVDATVFVARTAQVLDAAKVTGNARICGQAVIRRSAEVGGNAVITGFARVDDNAKVSGNAHVGGYAFLGGRAELTGNARLLEYARVDGEGAISGDVMVRGFGWIHLRPSTEITGTAMFGEDLEVHFADCKSPRFDGGLFYGFLDASLLRKSKEVADNRGLYAHWKMTGAHAPVLRDLVADADGTVHGVNLAAPSASFGRDGDIDFLRAGSAGVEVGGHVLATQDLGVDMLVRVPAEAKTAAEDGWAMRAVSGAHEFSFGPRKDGSLEFRLGEPGSAFTLAVPGKVPADRWVRLSLSIKQGVASLHVDGVKLAEKPLAGRALADLWAKPSLPNPAQTPVLVVGGQFRGQLAELKVTHTGELPGFTAAAVAK